MIDELKSQVRMVRDLEQQLHDVKQSIDELVKTGELSQEVIDFYYWETNLPTKTMGNRLGVHANLGIKATKNYFAEFQCCKCMKFYRILITSRTHYQSFLKPSVNRLCPSCIAELEAENEKRRQEWYIRFEQEQENKKQEINRLRSMPYTEYLKTDQWQTVKKRALKRADHRCQMCNNGGLLDVHHRTYERRGQEENTDVIVLCRACHSKFHDRSMAK